MYIKLFNPDAKIISLSTQFGVATVPANGSVVVTSDIANVVQAVCATLEHTEATQEEYDASQAQQAEVEKEAAEKAVADAKAQAKAEKEAQKRSAEQITAKKLADEQALKDEQEHLEAVKKAEEDELAKQSQSQVSRFDTHEVRAADTVNKMTTYANNKKGKKL